MLRRFLVFLLLTGSLLGQTTLRIFVEPFTGREPTGAALREEFLQQIRKRKDFIVVAGADQADRQVTILGETHVKGYIGRNLRVRYVNSDSQPVYGGYVSIELKTRHEQPVWSWLATPRRLGPDDVNRNLADQAVRKLTEFLSSPAAAKP